MTILESHLHSWQYYEYYMYNEVYDYRYAYNNNDGSFRTTDLYSLWEY